MSKHKHFQYLKQELLARKLDGLTEVRILKFWREYEPKKVEALLSQGILAKTMRQTAEALLDMQLALQESENLHPSLARMEAWRNLMRIEEAEDEADKEADWGPWREEYRELMDKQHR